jgi:hypothetical protein
MSSVARTAAPSDRGRRRVPAHCELRDRGSGASVLDLGSTNGTALDGVRSARCPGWRCRRVPCCASAGPRWYCVFLTVRPWCGLARQRRLSLNRPPRVPRPYCRWSMTCRARRPPRSGRGCRGCPSGISLALAGVLLIATGGRSTFLLLLLLSPGTLLATLSAIGATTRLRASPQIGVRDGARGSVGRHRRGLRAEAIDRASSTPTLPADSAACGPAGRLWERRPHDPTSRCCGSAVGTCPHG